MRRIVFVAAHVVTRDVQSGGDILCAHVAREIARIRPQWELVAIVPEFAREAYKEFFSSIVPLAANPGEPERIAGRPAAIGGTWFSRLAPCAAALRESRPSLAFTTGDFFCDVRPAARVRRDLGIPWSGIVHHLNPHPFVRHNDIPVATASYALQRWSLATLRTRCDRVAVTTPRTLADLVRLGFEASRISVVGAGIDLHRFALRTAPEGLPRVLWVHRLEPTKGVADLPALIAALPERVHIEIVGGGAPAVRERLVQALEAAGVRERVTIHGFVDDASLDRLYAGASAFISCSYEEGWGLSMAQALAVGLPCIAYDLPTYGQNFPGAIETVPVGDIAAFARAVRAVLERGDTVGGRLRRRAVVADHSFAAVAERLAAAFEASWDALI
ncbi:MAG: glycosyltransferase [Candidatus Baltobacteraceae bacterium]